MPRKPGRHAFTLIELLVVVTIIVILIAMLAPALDAAVYQAELTQCSANQDGAAMALNIYASNFKRSYPNRPGIGNYAMATTQLTGAGVNVNYTSNLKGYLSLNKHFNDPLTKKIELERSVTMSGVFTPYSYYAGAHFSQKNAAGTHQRGMNKLGDRLEYHLELLDNNTSTPYPGGPRKYDLLFGDYVYTANAVNAGESSHPDKGNKWGQRWRQDGPNRHESTAAAGVTQNTITETHWNGGIRGKQDTLDVNYAYADGSVRRVIDIGFPHDDRMDYLPHLWDNSYGWRIMVPKR